MSDNSIIGGITADDLIGTDESDLIMGLSGNDTINALAGEDIAFGGSGNDTINGGADSDLLVGDSGDGATSGGTGAQAFIKIDSTAGEFDGALLIEITDDAGNVRVETLASIYDASVGRTFTVDLDPADTILVGITSPQGTFYSNQDSNARFNSHSREDN